MQTLIAIWSWIEPILLVVSPIAALIFSCRSEKFQKLSLKYSQESLKHQQKAQEYMQARNQAKIICELKAEYDPAGLYKCTVSIKNIGVHTAKNVGYELKFYSDSSRGNMQPFSDSKQIGDIHSDESRTLSKIRIAKKEKANNFFILDIKYIDEIVNQNMNEKICKNLVYENESWTESVMNDRESDIVNSKFQS